MSADNYLFDDEEFRPDPQCDEQPLLPEGTYTSSEHQARVLEVAPQKITWDSGSVAFVSINTIIIDADQGAVFARSNAFGANHTQLGKRKGSCWAQFAANLKIDAAPQEGESVGDYWARIGEEAKDMPVTVTVGVNSYVRKEDRLSAEQRENGEEPRRTQKNFIRNIVRD